MADDFDQEAYDSLNWQLDDTQAQIYDYEYNNQILEGQISRLNAVKRELAVIKSDFKRVKAGTKNAVTDGYEWKGDTYVDFCSMGESLIDEVTDYYYYIDNILDMVNDKITELSNRRHSNLGIINDLYSWFNSLRNDIENLFN